MGNYENVTLHAGHVPGGGATGSGYEESAVARQFLPVLAAAFAKVGQRTVDCTDNVSTTQNANINRLISLCNAVNKNGRLDISLHFNKAEGMPTGVEVLYYDQEELARKVSAAISKAAGYRDRGPKERKDLGVLRGTNAPAILIELAFINNPDDMKKFFANMQAIASAIVQAVTGKTVSDPAPAPTGNPVWTGGYSPQSLPELCSALTSVKMTAKMTLQSDGYVVALTDPTSAAQKKAFTDFLDRKQWHWENR